MQNQAAYCLIYFFGAIPKRFEEATSGV